MKAKDDGFISELGCEVRVFKSPKHFAEGRVDEGEGALLTLRVPGQGQYAEVYLSKRNLLDLMELVAEVRDELGETGQWFCTVCETTWRIQKWLTAAEAYELHMKSYHPTYTRNMAEQMQPWPAKRKEA